MAAHEFGHVLGLKHRGGSSCSVMRPRAYEGRCRPSAYVGHPLAEQVRCIPAPADVRDAAKLYGGTPSRRALDCAAHR